MISSGLIQCKRKKCAGGFTIPIQVIISHKGGLYYFSRCPTCHKEYKIPFADQDEKILLEGAKPYFKFCDLCGTDNSDNYYIGKPHSMSEFRDRERIRFMCKNCGKDRVKIATDVFFSYLIDEPSNGGSRGEGSGYRSGLPIQRACNQCGKDISSNSPICEHCGRPISLGE